MSSMRSASSESFACCLACDNRSSGVLPPRQPPLMAASNPSEHAASEPSPLSAISGLEAKELRPRLPLAGVNVDGVADGWKAATAPLAHPGVLLHRPGSVELPSDRPSSVWASPGPRQEAALAEKPAGLTVQQRLCCLLFPNSRVGYPFQGLRAGAELPPLRRLPLRHSMLMLARSGRSADQGARTPRATVSPQQPAE
eukprot:CAMPEP_0172735136 /NCGR_PEP_ID=MMETSP1074-20121228/111769_1 /TAXON_ID=2916 /ORGANISM="Ceratium fusus, Strain PA161109" /LENGTH=197 /DNA_ID=CAMNT_0013564075 /DNA_START=247 /DNA_END=838 /DNA_ORIENTATION=-